MMSIATWHDYATHEDSAYPALWHDCVFACHPGLGITGGLLYDVISGYGASPANYAAGSWQLSGGEYSYLFAPDFPTQTNKAAIWPSVSIDTNCVSVSGWIRPGTLPSTDQCAYSLGSSGLNMRLIWTTAGTFTANWSTTTIVQTSTVAAAAEWHHFVMQRNRGRSATEFWLDGVLQSRSTTTLSTTARQPMLSIGARRDTTGSTAFFVGNFADFSIVQRMLSDDEIKLLSSARGMRYHRR